LHGWVYDIKAGEVAAYDDTSASWVPVEERYAADLASEMLSAHAC
jgi:carbonic anhydrase